jgi:uncharacterized RDD family membrane protein YckC
MEEPNHYPSAAEPQDLFTEGEFIEYTEATTTQRFVNYLIDLLVMRFGISWATSYGLFFLLNSLSPGRAYELFNESPLLLTAYVIAFINHLIYYTICEKAFRGYTLGKLITRTRVIREDGGELTLADALLRSLCRLVPFEAFSIWFGNGPWHDIWTKTKVVQVH